MKKDGCLEYIKLTCFIELLTLVIFVGMCPFIFVAYTPAVSIIEYLITVEVVVFVATVFSILVSKIVS